MSDELDEIFAELGWDDKPFDYLNDERDLNELDAGIHYCAMCGVFVPDGKDVCDKCLKKEGIEW